jgi:hypothetical protein
MAFSIQRGTADVVGSRSVSMRLLSGGLKPTEPCAVGLKAAIEAIDAFL